MAIYLEPGTLSASASAFFRSRYASQPKVQIFFQGVQVAFSLYKLAHIEVSNAYVFMRAAMPGVKFQLVKKIISTQPVKTCFDFLHAGAIFSEVIKPC